MTQWDACLGAAEQAWDDVLAALDGLEIPPMPEDAQYLLDLRVLRRIHHADSANQLTWLMTVGVVEVAAALLSPFVAPGGLNWR